MKNAVILFILLGLAACNDMNQLSQIGKDKDSVYVPGKATPYTHPDVLVYGQANVYEARANNARPMKNNIYPREIMKIGSKFVLCDSLHHRVLIFGAGGLTTDPELVLGQPNFESGIVNTPNSVVSATGMNSPSAIASNGTNLLISDSANNRILIWNTFPTSNQQAPDLVLGQPDFVTNTAPTVATSSNLKSPYGIVFVGGKLYVADYGQHRILIYNSMPTQTNQAADAVMGQADFISSTANRGGAAGVRSFSSPLYLATNGSKLAVSDYANNRVLIWNTLPSGDTDADAVVGQPDFTTVTNAAAQNKLYRPGKIAWNGSDLIVPDYFNHRVMVWSNVASTGTAGNASAVFGQADFTSNTANRGLAAPTSGSVYYPFTVSVIDNKTYIGDLLNYRVLVLNSYITGTGTSVASSVFGQANFTENYATRTQVNSSGFNDPRCLAVGKKYVVIGDRVNNRVLVFDKFAMSNAPEAIAVIGQPDFNSVARNSGGIGPKTYSSDFCGLALDEDERLYVSDFNNSRILVFNKIPTTNFMAADFVIGQADFVTATTGTAQNKMSTPIGIAVSNHKLIAADYNNNRVLVYDLPITSNFPDASAVIGQADYTTNTNGTTANSFWLPWAISIDPDGRLWVTDYYNNRLMIWNTIPTGTSSPATSANYVLGQASFTTNTGAVSTSKFQKSGANGIHSHGIGFMNGYAIVTDNYANRILGFNLSNLATGMSATYVWGQADFVSSVSTVIGLNGSFGHFGNPVQVLVDPHDNFVWISDRYRHRVLRLTKDHFWSKKVQ